MKMRLVYEDFVLVNSYAVFNTSNSGVATVSSSGVITPRNAGTATILARYNGRSAKVKLTVKSGSSSTTSSLRTQLVVYAKSFVGKLRYVYGGDSLVTGTDCSGFVNLIYAHFGISTARTAAAFQSMSNITRSQLQPGDLVTYRNGGHVAIYIGNGQVVHAKGTNYGTVIDNIDYGTPTGYVRILSA
ncbi:MAG: C40 family peptidase [Lachnospiraceae bacterium]|nr:C40 family peptidase [Lachnospiraceae bacterium]